MLVTGATGYVGSRLIRELQTRPDMSVRAMVRHPSDRLPIEQVVGDLSTGEGVTEACADIDVVVHLGGSNEVEAARDPDAALVDTSIGTSRVATAAAHAGAKRFVYLSTVHVYGTALEPGALVTEATVPCPRAVYGIARLAAEHLALSAGAGAMDVVVLRLTNSVGAPAHPAVDRWTLVGNDLCRQAALTGALRLHSDGTQWRDFVSLAEVCRLLSDAASGALGCGTYNAGSGHAMTVRQLAEIVQDFTESRTGARPPIEAPPATAPPLTPYEISVEKLAAAGFRLSDDITSAIDETVRFCLEWKDHIR